MFRKRRGLFLLCLLVSSLILNSFFSQAVFAQDNSDKFKLAKSIKVGQMVNGSIEKIGEKDYYVFKSSSSGMHIIRTIGNTDTFGCLYDSRFNLIKQNDEGDSATGNFLITAVLEQNKKYYIEVQYYSNNGTGLYNIKVEKRDVLVQTYNEISSEKDKLTISFLIFNIAKEPYDLKNLKLRYYFINEMVKDQKVECIYASVGKENVVGSIKRLKENIKFADSYIEIGYTDGAGTIDPGYSTEVKITIDNVSKTLSSIANYYSYFSGSEYYIINDHVTAYSKNGLIWGNEPDV